MPNAHGSFIWYELMTRDVTAAKAFYDAVIGWNIDAQPSGEGMDYRMINAPDAAAGGVLPLTEAMCEGGAFPTWLGYFGVDDVDATVAAMAKDGATVQMQPFDAPGVGRIAMVSDPQGIPFYVMRGASDENSTAYQRMGMGHVSWNELMAPDDAAALDFYGRHLAVAKVGSMPMGEMGEYSFIANGDSGGEAIGAIMRTPPGAGSGWSFYFRVSDIEAAHARVKQLGGNPLSDPIEVPGGERVFHATDPEGVVFGLVAPK